MPLRPRIAKLAESEKCCSSFCVMSIWVLLSIIKINLYFNHLVLDACGTGFLFCLWILALSSLTMMSNVLRERPSTIFLRIMNRFLASSGVNSSCGQVFQLILASSLTLWASR